MYEKIEFNRYLFTESLAFKARNETKEKYLLKEGLRILPIISLLIEAKELKHTLKRRNFYRHHKHEGYIYDVRFSNLSIAKHTINLVGLGILLIPVRAIATRMHNEDKSNSRKCENPHLLDEEKLRTCHMINTNAQVHYEGILKHCPTQEDYCKRMAFRDHVQHPEYLHKSLYVDPFEKPSDKPIKNTIQQLMSKNLFHLRMKAKHILRGTYVKPKFSKHSAPVPENGGSP